MKLAHLIAMLMAALLLGAALVAGEAYAEALENRYVHALAPIHARLTFEGSALTRAALQQPDLLPIFGASEALVQNSKYQAATFFKNYPTGFETFEVAHAGAASLLTAQAIASLGPAARGKNIVITFTPSAFLVRQADRTFYSGLFSSLHANELAFNTQLSLDTKQAAARRMLQYPGTLHNDPLLQFALQHLASDSPLDHILYGLSLPLGRLQTGILELQDHFQAASSILSNPNLNPDVTRQPRIIDWSQLVAQARQEQVQRANNNPYGFDNQVWLRQFAPKFKSKTDGSGDQKYLTSLESSAEWTDLDILLRTLTELGAHPLLLGRPINQAYYEAIGISSTAQQAFYDRLHQIAARYHVPVVDFANYGSDKFFGTDAASHTSREGWVYVDQVLDEFFHGTLH
jgi:D-alanyl-lipoteichoic acid biosynthesis protein DltD